MTRLPRPSRPVCYAEIEDDSLLERPPKPSIPAPAPSKALPGFKSKIFESISRHALPLKPSRHNKNGSMSSSSESDDQGEFCRQENPGGATASQRLAPLGSTAAGRPGRPVRQSRNSKVSYTMDVDLHESSNEDSDSSGDGTMGSQPSSFKRLSRAPVAQKAAKKSADGTVSDSSSSDDAEEVDSDLDTDESDAEDVEDGGRWEVERLLDRRRDEASGEPEFLVKLISRSFRQTVWVSRAELLARGKRASLQALERRLSASPGDEDSRPPGGVDPEWLVVERVIGQRAGKSARRLLVKWRGLGYASSTWEPEAALQGSEADLAAVRAFDSLEARVAAPLPRAEKSVALDRVPVFCNGRALRDYQQLSLAWMASNWARRQNCILGDEMGLGKTAQSIAILCFQRQVARVSGSFLIVAPLTTLGHWQREVQTWSDLDVVLYCGHARDREILRRHDFFRPKAEGAGPESERLVRPDVVLVSYELLRRDLAYFQRAAWASVVVDEAHRLKNARSGTSRAVCALRRAWLLLLTGTPVQNNMADLQGLLSVLDADLFGDQDDFFARYGDDRGAPVRPEQLAALQARLRPLLLRRLKEDVETLPQKEEVVIWVELAAEQRLYYRAIYEKQIGALMEGASARNLPNLRNLAMELRKVCCHPFLCTGVESDLQARREAAGMPSAAVQLLVEASGKMVLLAKLLPKLRSEGRKVVVFSQFKMMLDVLEDWIRGSGWPLERIDGDTPQRDRQKRIDRFCESGDGGAFVFLLSTRAGGQGITLTAADTVVIYDSDWNPQNDLQAMARCHRIGQSKKVTVYRLLARDTYEAQVFEASSRKQGLDEALLGSLAPRRGGEADPEKDLRRIGELLKHGAHGLADPAAAEAASAAFQAEDIDSILTSRSERRQLGSAAGNTFSVATFSVPRPPGRPAKGASAGEAAFWTALLPEAAAAAARQSTARHAQVAILQEPRKRRAVNYAEGQGKRRARARAEEEPGAGCEPEGEEVDASYEPEGEEAAAEARAPARPRRPKPAPSGAAAAVQAFVECLLERGLGHGPAALAEAGAAWEGEDAAAVTPEEALVVERFLVAAVARQGAWARRRADLAAEFAAQPERGGGAAGAATRQASAEFGQELRAEWEGRLSGGAQQYLFGRFAMRLLTGGGDFRRAIQQRRVLDRIAPLLYDEWAMQSVLETTALANLGWSQRHSAVLLRAAARHGSLAAGGKCVSTPAKAGVARLWEMDDELRESVAFVGAGAAPSQDCVYSDRLSLPTAAAAEDAAVPADLARVLKTMLNRLTEPGCAEQLRARLVGPGQGEHSFLDLQLDDVFQLPSEQGVAEVVEHPAQERGQLEALPPAPAVPVAPSQFQPAWLAALEAAALFQGCQRALEGLMGLRAAPDRASWLPSNFDEASARAEALVALSVAAAPEGAAAALRALCRVWLEGARQSRCLEQEVARKRRELEVDAGMQGGGDGGHVGAAEAVERHEGSTEAEKKLEDSTEAEKKQEDCAETYALQDDLAACEPAWAWLERYASAVQAPLNAFAAEAESRALAALAERLEAAIELELPAPFRALVLTPARLSGSLRYGAAICETLAVHARAATASHEGSCLAELSDGIAARLGWTEEQRLGDRIPERTSQPPSVRDARQILTKLRESGFDPVPVARPLPRRVACLVPWLTRDRLRQPPPAGQGHEIKPAVLRHAARAPAIWDARQRALFAAVLRGFDGADDFVRAVRDEASARERRRREAAAEGHGTVHAASEAGGGAETPAARGANSVPDAGCLELSAAKTRGKAGGGGGARAAKAAKAPADEGPRKLKQTLLATLLRSPEEQGGKGGQIVTETAQAVVVD